MLNKTVFYDDHLLLSAQMVAFANTLLPVRYHSEKEEHLVVRNAVGMFDVSHMGEFVVEGENAASFLNHILSNDVDNLSINHAHYSLLLNDDGGIIDDLIVYRLAKHRYLLCVNASNIEKDFSHIKAMATGIDHLMMENISAAFAQIALQGPRARALLRSLSSDSLPERFFVNTVAISGAQVLAACTGYTGEDGFELFIKNHDAKKIWQLLYEAGQSFGLKPCGLAARDSLRLEAGMLLHGQDINDTTTPLEAGLQFAIAWHKENFIGKHALLKQKKCGVTKKIVGFSLRERGIARHGFSVVDANGKNIGSVTSGTLIPAHETAVGFAIVDKSHAILGKEIFIDVRGRLVKALVTKPRFLNKGIL